MDLGQVPSQPTQYPKRWRYGTHVGSGTFTIDPSGFDIQKGDLCIFAATTRNSTIGADALGGGTWTRVLRYDSGSNEWHYFAYKIATDAEKDVTAWTLTQSGNGTALGMAIRPNLPIKPVFPQYDWARYRGTIPVHTIPRNALDLDVVLGSYGVGGYVMNETGWRMGHVKQSNDEAVYIGWHPGYGTKPIRSFLQGFGSGSQYWATMSIWWPTLSPELDSEVR